MVKWYKYKIIDKGVVTVGETTFNEKKMKEVLKDGVKLELKQLLKRGGK